MKIRCAKRGISRLLAGLCTILFLGPVAWAAEATDPNRPLTQAALQARLQALVAQQRVPGASYALFGPEGVLAEGAFGIAAQDPKRPLTATTLMQAGSITKTLTAIAVLQLVERGQVTLSTPVRDLLPEAPIVNPWEATDPVRVVHLLEHSAGFDDTSLSKLFIERETAEGHLASLRADSRPLRVRWRPGKMMSYSNPGYAVLGALLEKQTGMLWEDVIRKHVLGPLGMAHSVLTIAEALQRDHSVGHRGSPNAPVPFLPMPDRAAGALWTTPRDLSLLGRFLMTDGHSAPGVLKPETVRDMKQVHSTGAAKQGLNWGYSLGVQRSSALGAEWLGHNGTVHGASAMLQIQPQRAMGGAGLNWLLGVAHLYRDPKDATKLILKDPLGPPVAFFSADDRLLTGAKHGFTKTALIRSGGRVEAIDNNGFYLERVSAFSALAPMIAIPLGLLALATVPFGRRKALRNPWLRRLPSLALASLIASIGLMFQVEITTFGQINAPTVGIFLGTLLLPVFSVAGLVLSLRSWKSEPARVARWRCLLGSLGAVGISIYFACFHWMPLALWRW